MGKERGLRRMLLPTIVMGIIAIVMLYIGYQRGGGAHIAGLKITGNLLLEITPLLIFSFIIAGMIQVLIPRRSYPSGSARNRVSGGS